MYLEKKRRKINVYEEAFPPPPPLSDTVLLVVTLNEEQSRIVPRRAERIVP